MLIAIGANRRQNRGEGAKTIARRFPSNRLRGLVMHLHDPVAAYIAATNIEAHLIRNLLIEAGINAAVEEDVSQVGVWWLGLASQLHRPKVWIERTDLLRAESIVAAYENDCAARRAAERGEADSNAEPIGATCEECATTSIYPNELRGTVQVCPKCGAYVDVGDDDPGFDWS